MKTRLPQLVLTFIELNQPSAILKSTFSSSTFKNNLVPFWYIKHSVQSANIQKGNLSKGC